MNYISFCSGVEAATLAWHGLGWRPVAFSEIEPFPCAVLASRWPDVPNLGDCTKIHYKQGELYNERRSFKCGNIDLAVGGFPCQSFSVAGKRLGLEGASGLVREYFRLLSEARPRWMVYENVPGMLSSSSGYDFAVILSGLCGWDVPVPGGGWKNSGICTNAPGCFGVAWRTLDCQYTRVPGFPRAIPQRRRRVFLVGYRGQPDGSPRDWERAAEVLFDGEGLFGNPPSRRTEKQTAPADAGEGAQGADSGAVGDGDGRDGGCATVRMREGCDGGGKGPLVSEGRSLALATANDQVLFRPQTGRPWDESGVNPTLNQACGKSGGIGASDQEIFSQKGNGLVLDMQGGKAGAKVSADGSCPTILRGRGDANDIHCVGESAAPPEAARG